jgi:hypothetical protein
VPRLRVAQITPLAARFIPLVRTRTCGAEALESDATMEVTGAEAAFAGYAFGSYTRPTGPPDG